MRSLTLIGLLPCLLLAACARSPRLAASYVSSKVGAVEIEAVCADATRHLAATLPPAQTTVLIAPAKSRRGEQLGARLAEYLRASGFGVIEADARDSTAAAHAVALRYLVSRVDDGLVLHLQYHGIEASRFYPRAADGALIQTMPFAVRGSP